MMNSESAENKKRCIVQLVCVCATLACLSGCALTQAPTKIFFVLILSAVIFLITLLRTDAALVILIFSMLLSPEIPLGAIPGREVVLRFDDVLLLSVFLGWLAKMAVNKEFGLVRATRLNKPILIFTTVCIISSLFAIIQGRLSWKISFFYLLKYIEYYILFFMVVNNLRSMKQAKIFVVLMFVVCAIVSVYAITQIGTGVRVSTPFEGEIGEANTLGGYLLIFLSLGFSFFLCASTLSRKIALLGFLALAVVPFLYTLSRGAWVGSIAMFASFIFLHKKARLFLIAIVLVMIFFLPHFMPKQVTQRVEETFTTYKTYTFFGKTYSFDESTTARIESWREAFEKWKKRPIFGYGTPPALVIDNQYARVLREAGILGFFAFLWLLSAILAVGWRAFKTCGSGCFESGLSMGYVCGCVGLLVHALSAETFIIVRIMEPFWFLTAIIVLLPELQKVSEPIDTIKVE